ncbi:histidine kinase [Paenibacillus sp. UMB4589-SE434]|uniref:histidine kinase n=1 Tax=Paenibacillus sp. UMB4589-SE434 TaxID=3046314 RepID=UPI0025511A58|nr:histidine kinase [Paenibacillus sp. UMB4589-SE434]MDK8183655.1 histidine kinase [Paenibacillus sp. UMB4589-SE434]
MKESDAYRRRSPEVLLQLIEQMQRGRLCILVAVASGAGKTTQLEREGQERIKQGLEVAWATSSPEQEPASSLISRIPSIEWEWNGQRMEDLDMTQIQAGSPDIVLVDGLAQPNRSGAERATRLEDVRYLLQLGISVIATMNAYEDERVSEQAKKMTGIDAIWTIPGDVLKEADEVRLLDVSAESLIERRQHHRGRGKETRASTRKELVSERSQLSILRELALRTLASDVNGSLEQHRQELGLSGPSGVAERILVLAQYGWNGSIHVRRGHQISKRLNGELFIISFVHPKKALTPIQTTFRRSLKKLAAKLGASWEETASSSRSGMARLLARYAWEHGMTRIVLGHSRQTRWQEFWNGSLINGLLKEVEHTDLFFVADRSMKEGERILPVRSETSHSHPPFKRWTQAELLAKADGLRRGRFKIIIGAAPGVGKTYKMLQEGNRLLEQGVDVVIGLLETHGRKETKAQVNQLPLIPRSKIAYNERFLEEMDTERLLQLRPELVLVDELAHTNMPGSQHDKRYEDVLQLLEAGISVMTTINIQHIESLNDAVEQLTGVRVRETVPDGVLRLADEMELIDVTPHTIQERMRSGLIYSADKVNQALDHFFRTSNLIGLRELALREVADDVDERLESWERRALLRGPWRRQEVIFVCIEPNTQAERLVRHGFRIAHRLKAELFVACLPIMGRSKIEEKGMKSIKSLAERLGGTFEMYHPVLRKQWASTAVKLADAQLTTQLIVGLPGRKQRRMERQQMKMLMRLSRHMDVLVMNEIEWAKGKPG